MDGKFCLDLPDLDNGSSSEISKFFNFSQLSVGGSASDSKRTDYTVKTKKPFQYSFSSAEGTIHPSQVGHHRSAGHKGGHGKAGLHKHNRTKTVMFGQAGFNPPTRNATRKWNRYW